MLTSTRSFKSFEDETKATEMEKHNSNFLSIPLRMKHDEADEENPFEEALFQFL